MDQTLLFSGAAFILAVCFVCYRRRKNNQTMIAAMGLDGPKPNFFLGSLKDILSARLYQDILQKWTQEYGKTFGYYEGGTAVVVTSDVDIIREVFVKQFHKFDCHKRLPLQPDPENDAAHIFLLHGPKWKRIRTICNPSFTTGKIKWMTSGAVTNKLTALIDKFRETDGQGIDVVDVFQSVMLDIILDVAFGIEIDAQKHPDAPLLVKTRNMFTAMGQIGILPYVLNHIPCFHTIMFGSAKLLNLTGLSKILPSTAMSAGAEIAEILEEIIERRQKDTEYKRSDLLQSLIDAEIKDDVGDVTGDKKLGKMELVTNAILFLMAGYETTSSTLAFAAYLLAMNPDKQSKLLAEIDKETSNEDEISYTTVSRMNYLDMVLREALRLYPVGGNVVNRICNEETVINGVKFMKGVSIQANVWAVHNDPLLWGPEDPTEFEPERFLTERKGDRHPMAWLPFGIGPRECLGKRMAIVEAKMTLARVLKEFTFVAYEETEPVLKLKDVMITTNPKNGIFLKVIPR